jgi:hypothetical protein
MNNKEFSNQYMNLSRMHKYHINVRNEIVNKCQISTPIFYNWSKGITPVPHWAKPIIAGIMQVEVYKLFPDNELEQIEDNYLITRKELNSLDEAITVLYQDSHSQHQVDVVNDLKSIREKIQFLNRNKHDLQECN